MLLKCIYYTYALVAWQKSAFLGWCLKKNSSAFHWYNIRLARICQEMQPQMSLQRHT